MPTIREQIEALHRQAASAQTVSFSTAQAAAPECRDAVDDLERTVTLRVERNAAA
jgi:hypothetical protein